jgi:hypothetical protein
MLGFDPDSVERTFTNGLIVVGAFAVGYLLTGVVAHYFDRWATRNQSPQGLHKLIRWIGGIVVALIVALYLFKGGKGTGGTGGEGDGPSPQLPGTGNVNAPITSPTSPTTKPVPNVQTHEIIRVTILGGFHDDGKYYVAEDDGQRVNDFSGIKAYVQSREKAAEKPAVLEIRLAATNRTTRGNEVVKQLENWARNEERLGVIFPGDGP